MHSLCTFFQNKQCEKVSNTNLSRYKNANNLNVEERELVTYYTGGVHLLFNNTLFCSLLVYTRV